jgi:Zn-dependent peptidase ImmA (M78 family)
MLQELLCRKKIQRYPNALIDLCRSRLAELELDHVSVATVKRRLEEQTGRTITLVPMALTALEPCGMCLSGDTEDFIVFNNEVSSFYQDHIIAHELGHLLCGHTDSAGGGLVSCSRT